jgi:Porin PorA
VADRYYQAGDTFWVDPRTGVVIDIEQRVLSVLRGPGGQGRLVVADMDPRAQAARRGGRFVQDRRPEPSYRGGHGIH